MHKINGLYAITPDGLAAGELYRQCDAALQGGARLLQYRDKQNRWDEKCLRAQRLAALCQQYHALFIVNDDVQLALQCDADGVHLGGEDGNIAEARKQLGSDKILGISCYNQLEKAQMAQRFGADYVAFGAVFPSATKPAAVPASLDLLSEARQKIALPIVAIGGIGLENCAAVVNAGADSIAVINALFAAQDIQHTALLFSRCFT